MDGQAGAEYDGIAAGSMIFSADGKRMAYVAQKGAKQMVVVDGEAGPEYDEIGKGTLIFSADGKRVAYGAQKGAKRFVVVDGQAGPGDDGISPPLQRRRQARGVWSPEGREAGGGGAGRPSGPGSTTE